MFKKKNMPSTQPSSERPSMQAVRAFNEITRIGKDVKKKYDALDPVTKKKIVTGVAALGGLLIGLAAAKKRKTK